MVKFKQNKNCWLPTSVVWSEHLVFVWLLFASDSSSWVAIWSAQIRCQMCCSTIYGVWFAQIRCQMCLLLTICANQSANVRHIIFDSWFAQIRCQMFCHIICDCWFAQINGQFVFWLSVSVAWPRHMLLLALLLASDSSSCVAIWSAQIRWQMYCNNRFGMWFAQIRCHMCLLLKICNRICANQMSNVLP